MKPKASKLKTKNRKLGRWADQKMASKPMELEMEGAAKAIGSMLRRRGGQSRDRS